MTLGGGAGKGPRAAAPRHTSEAGKKKTKNMRKIRMAVTAGTRTKHTGLSLLGCKSVFRASRCLQVIHPESALLLRRRHMTASTCSPSYSWSLHTSVSMKTASVCLWLVFQSVSFVCPRGSRLPLVEAANIAMPTFRPASVLMIKVHVYCVRAFHLSM